MLAQNFLSHDILGISDIELDALIKVLGMLERGELVHGKYPIAAMFRGQNEFNMAATLSEEECGTIGCLCGWAHVVSGHAAFAGFANTDYSIELNSIDAMPAALRRLFGIGESWRALNPRTPEQAAIALRSYLTLGEANWTEALAQ